MISYLIGLGTLRALSRHGVSARMWCDGIDMVCDHSVADIDYRPPAVCSPWNGRWDGASGRKLRAAILATDDDRRADLRRAVQTAEQSLSVAPKAERIGWLRSNGPDDLVDWIDATWWTETTPVWLAGTGGNWGSQDLSVHVMRAALDPDSRDFTARVYGGGTALTGTEYLLAMEGIIALAPSATRRLRVDDATQPMRAATCVAETVMLNDRVIGSWWLPWWPQPATYAEVQALCAGHPGWDTDVKAATWVASGCAERGVSAYCRWAIVQGADTVYRGVQP
ncbi:MAG: hypothetical protein KGL39_50660 [Patescibacteria group bacterium]|nr:hypothetical protein [Patescibacteria group bacterium]